MFDSSIVMACALYGFGMALMMWSVYWITR